jgi:hypothetical protein
MLACNSEYVSFTMIHWQGGFSVKGFRCVRSFSESHTGDSGANNLVTVLSIQKRFIKSGLQVQIPQERVQVTPRAQSMVENLGLILLDIAPMNGGLIHPSANAAIVEKSMRPVWDISSVLKTGVGGWANEGRRC